MRNKRIKRTLRQMLPYLLGFLALYYLVPLVTKFDLQAADSRLLLNMLLIFNPAMSFVLNIMYAVRYGFCWYFPLVAGALFAPTVPLYYNSTAIIYIFSYVVLAFVGAASGYSIYKNREGND